MIRLFIEAGRKETSEYRFIEVLLQYSLGDSWKSIFEIITVGGKDNLDNVSPKFIENTLQGGKNIVLFDADSIENQGGFESRQKLLLDKQKRLGIEFELFLFPNNHNDGDFETLLEGLINEEHQCLLDCFHSYEQCITRTKTDRGECKYESPNQKAKMYAYITSMKLSSSRRGKLGQGEWLFDDPRYWNLDSKSIGALNFFLTTQTTQASGKY